MGFTTEKPEEIEAHLGSHPYLSEGGLPGAADAEVYFSLNGRTLLSTQKSPMSRRLPISIIGSTSSEASQMA